MLDDHHDWLTGRRRLSIYEKTLEALITPQSVVVDLGCGSGILGLLALRAGARHVHAVEEADVIEVARKTFSSAGLSDRVTFHRTHSSLLRLTELADLVLCDHVGFFGFDYGIVPTLADARARLLKPEGVLVPNRLRLFVAAVQSPLALKPVTRWCSEDVPREYRWLQDAAANHKHAVEVEPEALLSDPVCIADYALGSDIAPPRLLSEAAVLRIQREGTAHGLLGWFEAELAPGIWMTNAPGHAGRIGRPQALLPLRNPIQLAEDEALEVTLRIRREDGLIAWTAQARGRPETRMQHSTWEGGRLSPDDLARLDPAKYPTPNEKARAQQIVLGYCDGVRSAAEIEAIILREHAGLFPSERALRAFVAKTLLELAG